MTRPRRLVVRVCTATLAVLWSTSCVSIGSLGIVSRSGSDPGELLTRAHTYRELGQVGGRACRYFVLAIIPFGDSTISKATSNALQESGGDALVNVSTSSSLYALAPLYSILSFTCTSVQGTAVKIEAVPDVALVEPKLE